ncbi:RagB/SusD family nutrient uptake outer membrane protein [Pedobacter sp. SL55]|uniref:RagB/SusD family nutrient uptake outer membrane protein n=1 Tax=Pedobacter sp. SL55 TaxID=2995161 RepID=UPI00226FCE3C|nr:RagB/SusD family nutrient uptake outer membrane protein [Pedobacter sp. SL55]WAC41624.1 RagB/SusD family nutrient uptake outer membrane protein [Pedobacter sp. SL55]
MKKYIYTFLISTLFLISCDKYLDVKPKGVRLLETIRDYDEWLNNMDLETSTSPLLNWLDDRKDLPTLVAATAATGVNERIYSWQAQAIETVPGTAPIWSTLYKTIYLYNTVIIDVEKAKDGTEQQKQRLKAEALLGRAFEYLYLVNLYGKVYNPATAGKDLAVPFVTSVDVTDEVPNRSTVQEIYDHIINDITAALPYLPADNNSNRFRGSVAAAHGVLAKTYLYMGNYPKAAQEAQLALNTGPNMILDYTTIANAAAIPHLIKRSDAIYARIGGSSYISTEIPTQAFLKTFNTKDLRLKFFYSPITDLTFATRGRTIFRHSGVVAGSGSPNWGIAVAEMHLIIAEAAVRNNEFTKACDELDILRKRRFLAADYVKFTSTDKETVFNKVFEERGFELAFVGMRWFDMRRLDAEGRMPAVSRYLGNGQLLATLEPNSPRYTLQIPKQVMFYNPTWEQNP